VKNTGVITRTRIGLLAVVLLAGGCGGRTTEPEALIFPNPTLEVEQILPGGARIKGGRIEIQAEQRISLSGFVNNAIITNPRFYMTDGRQVHRERLNPFTGEFTPADDVNPVNANQHEEVQIVAYSPAPRTENLNEEARFNASTIHSQPIILRLLHAVDLIPAGNVSVQQNTVEVTTRSTVQFGSLVHGDPDDRNVTWLVEPENQGAKIDGNGLFTSPEAVPQSSPRDFTVIAASKRDPAARDSILVRIVTGGGKFDVR
jgi:hypothetical protein